MAPKNLPSFVGQVECLIRVLRSPISTKKPSTPHQVYMLTSYGDSKSLKTSKKLGPSKKREPWMTNFCFPKTWSHCHQKLWMKIENFKIHHKGNTHPVGFFIKIWVIFLKFIPPMWCFFIWVFPKTGVPQNGWFIRENLIRNDDLRVPLFLETPIFCKNPTDPRRKKFVPPLCTAAAAKRLGPSWSDWWLISTSGVKSDLFFSL